MCIRDRSIAWDSGAKPVVVLTKSDICEDIEEKLNQSIRQYHPEYWRARQSGREAAEAARSTAPAKEAAR